MTLGTGKPCTTVVNCCRLHKHAPELLSAVKEAVTAHGWTRLQEDANRDYRIRGWLDIVNKVEAV